MSLSQAYAQVIREKGDESGFLKKVAEFMKSKGHLVLFPEILRILMRDPQRKGAAVYVARAADERKFAGEIKAAIRDVGETDADIVIDQRIVGGFLVRGKSKVIDQSYRSALVSMYQKTLK